MSNRKPTFSAALRMIDLILELDQRRYDWPVQEAARTLEVDPKTIKRYVDALGKRLITSDGQPAISIRAINRRPHICVNGPMLSLDSRTYDYVSVFLASRFLDFLPKDSILLDGLEKMAEAMFGSIRENAPARQGVLERFSQKFSVFHTGQHMAPDDEVLGDLISGLILEKKLSLRYGGWPEARLVDPLTLMVYKEGLYLIVRMGDGPKPYVLSVPLIREVELSQERFTPPADWDPAVFRGERFGMFPGDSIEVTLRCHAKLRNYLENRVWGQNQRVEAISDEAFRFTLRTTLSPEFVSWVSSFGPDMTVEGPETLRQAICERMQATLDQYAAI